MTIQDPDSLRESLDEKEDKEEKTYLNKTHAFDLNVEGENGRKWQGRFVYEVPNIGEKIKIGQMKAIYLPQGAMADPSAAGLTEMVCYLSVTLKEKPNWFKPMELTDEIPLAKVYEEVLDYEQKFHGNNEVERTDGAGSGGSQGSGETDSTDVGRKVQSPDERSETIISHD
jgi:hypothetical protein